MRLVFEKQDQIEFFKRVREQSHWNRDALGALVGIVGRNYGDWTRAKLLPTKAGVEILSNKFSIPVPKILEIREEWWSGRAHGRDGAIARMKLYGPPGTPEGRKKGGLISQQRRRENPEYYRSLGCLIRKNYKFPKKSVFLAEFVGITLGDGGITDQQIKITLNSEADKQYILYVKRLITKLFGYEPSMFIYKHFKAVNLYFGGINLIEYLRNLGLKVGNKVKLQVDVPDWIKNNANFSKFCLRGLMDTDGGIFAHNYSVGGKKYSYLKLNFSNMSQPLRRFVFRTLAKNGFSPKYAGVKHVWLYSATETQRYLQVIGSSNYRLLRKFEI